MSAAQSGLSHSTAVSAALATSTWSDLHRRQQRLVSGLGEAERRIAIVTAKLEGLGWANPNKRGPQMQVRPNATRQARHSKLDQLENAAALLVVCQH